jgi:hypothetical protein
MEVRIKIKRKRTREAAIMKQLHPLKKGFTLSGKGPEPRLNKPRCEVCHHKGGQSKLTNRNGLWICDRCYTAIRADMNWWNAAAKAGIVQEA